MSLNTRPAGWRVPLAIFCCVICLGQSVHAQDDKPTNKRELEVLAKYTGTWETTRSDGDDTSVDVILDDEWILEGTFLQRKGRLSDGRVPQLMLMTYDGDTKQYRSWNFNSYSRTPIEFHGTWDEARQTMTWVADLSDGGTLTQTATFNSDATQSWTSVFRAADGKAVGPMRSGKNRRTDAP